MIENSTRRISITEKGLLSLGLFSAFIKPFGLLVSLLALHIGTVKMPARVWMLMLCGVFFLLISVVKGANISHSILVWRFYFGFIIYLPFFASFRNHTLFTKITYFLIFSLFIETVLINTIIDPRMMPNFPTANSHFAVDGNYQRPMSIGGIASFSSVIFVILIYEFLDLKKKSTLFIMLMSVAIFSSGNGFIAFLMYQLKNLSLKIFMGTAALIILGITLFVNLDIEYTGLQKLSGQYINFLLEYKKGQIIEVLSDFSNIEFLIGGIGRPPDDFGGDFGFLYLIESYISL